LVVELHIPAHKTIKGAFASSYLLLTFTKTYPNNDLKSGISTNCKFNSESHVAAHKIMKGTFVSLYLLLSP
jgi:hypothetical protein